MFTKDLSLAVKEMASLDPNEEIKIRTDAECGILLRTRFRAFLNYHNNWDSLKVEWTEDKGLLFSYFTIKASGPVRSVLAFTKALKAEEN